MLYNLQYLRFIAASLVLLHHIFQFAIRFQVDAPQFEAGAAGVDLFFVISGFIMVFITEKKQRTPLAFFQHRLARVVPPYWVVTALLATALSIFPHAFATSKLSFPHLLASLLFVPYTSPTGKVVPLYAPGWTLNYEFFFYSLFALVLVINPRQRVALVSSILISIVAAGYFELGNSLLATYYTNPILLEFAYGMFIGHLAIKGGGSIRFCNPNSLIALGLAGLIAATLYLPQGPQPASRFLVWGLPAAFVIAGSVSSELSHSTKFIWPLALLGDASYAIYVTHYVVLSIIFKVWDLIELPTLLPIVVVASFTVCIAAGLVFHLYVERPLVSLFSWNRSGLLPRLTIR
jgi:exopolysaccharide production protein ExoZ